MAKKGEFSNSHLQLWRGWRRRSCWILLLLLQVTIMRQLANSKSNCEQEGQLENPLLHPHNLRVLMALLLLNSATVFLWFQDLSLTSQYISTNAILNRNARPILGNCETYVYAKNEERCSLSLLADIAFPSPKITDHSL